MEQATVNLVKVRSWNSLLHVLLYVFVTIKNQFWDVFNFGYHIMWACYVYVSKDVRIHGYFFKSNRGYEKKNLWNTDIKSYNFGNTDTICRHFFHP